MADLHLFLENGSRHPAWKAFLQECENELCDLCNKNVIEQDDIEEELLVHIREKLWTFASWLDMSNDCIRFINADQLTHFVLVYG